MPRKSAAPVTARLVRIGNSWCPPIPGALLKKAGIIDHVTLAVRDGALFVKADPKSNHSRAGWHEALIAAGAGSEELLWPDDMETDFDKTGWTW